MLSLTTPPATPTQDLRLQIEERCTYIQKVNSLCLEIGNETSDGKVSPEGGQDSHNPELAKLATEVRDLNDRFATTCLQAKQHYAELSSAIGGDRPESSLSRQGISPHLPPRPGSKSSGKSRHKPRSEKRKHRKRTQSLYVEEEQADAQSPNKSETANSKVSPKLRKSQSWSLPTDLDDMIKQQSIREAPGSHGNGMGGGSNNDQQNPSTADKQETQKIYSFSTPIKIPRPRLDHCESLDSPRQATGSFERDHSPSNSLRGSKRSKRPKSAVFVSGDAAQFCYLDEHGSPINSNSPVLKLSSDKAASIGKPSSIGKPTTFKLEAAARTSQRSSVTSFGDTSSLSPSEDFRLVHQLVDNRRMSTDQNASVLSSGSSVSGFHVTGSGRSEGGPRLSKSMDELITVGVDKSRSKWFSCAS